MTSSADLTLPPITWVDVARRLSIVTRSGLGDDITLAPPGGVLETEAFWTGLTVTLANAAVQSDACTWLSRLFPSRITGDGATGECALKLDAPPGMDVLPVTFEVQSATNSGVHTFRPTAALDGRHWFDVAASERPSDPLPLIAFHSVKGGAGRTTAAIAFARYLGRESGGKTILIVDGDFEAPGLSYLFAVRKPESAISFEDLLVLAHEDPGEDLRVTIEFVVSGLTEQRIDDLFILPAKRSTAALSAFAIRPEHIVGARRGRPFLIVDMLRDIAKRLGCCAVVIDLRAGLVEIAMQVLTDPTVERAFVTTTSGQSLAATCGMISVLGQVERETRAPGRKPLVIINQFPTFQLHDRRAIDEITAQIEAAAVSAFQATAAHAPTDKTDVNADVEFGVDSPLTFVTLPHSVDLVQTSRDWDKFTSQIDGSGFSRSFESQLGSWSAVDAIARSRKRSTEISSPDSSLTSTNQKEGCQKLSRVASEMVVAESASQRLETPLMTPPLRRLADDFQKHSPIAVIEGAKGTGKTLTFRFLVEQQTWRMALKGLDSQLSAEIEGTILPVYGSSQTDQMITLLNERTAVVARSFSDATPMSFSELRRQIQTRLKESLTEAEWADFWLDTIGWVSGYDIEKPGAWAKFLLGAKARKDNPIAVFEGLEEIIQDPYADTKQATALRALLVEVPLRLRQEVGRPVGCLIFVRGDMVEAVIRQNIAQFRASYRNYALAWSSVDILELVIWLVSTSNAITGLWSRTWRDKGDETRAIDLARVWGQKLGNENSREARSTEWVLAVLTDLNGKLTARDLVRFIANAAKGSVDDTPPDGRLLAPAAMRRAVTVTSQEKVQEYPSEVAVLGPIFEKLRKAPNVETPLDRQTAGSIGLDDSELKNLQAYGVFFEEGGQFEVPELFRIGLGLKRRGARPNIISLTRRALERASTAI